MIVNAGRWLLSGPCPTPTPTPTATTHINSYSHSNGNGNADSYAHTNRYACGHDNCYFFSYANSYINFDTETFTDAETGANV